VALIRSRREAPSAALGGSASSNARSIAATVRREAIQGVRTRSASTQEGLGLHLAGRPGSPAISPSKRAGSTGWNEIVPRTGPSMERDPARLPETSGEAIGRARVHFTDDEKRGFRSESVNRTAR
jgi:hypothetical protein